MYMGTLGDGNDDGALCAAGMAAVAGEDKVRAVQLGADPDALDDTCRKGFRI